MDTVKLLAFISRNFLRDRQVLTYRMKKISDMSDNEVIRKCHWYCEENNLMAEFRAYRESVESEYRYCGYLQEYIDDGLCADIQMIAYGYIKHEALPKYRIDIEAATARCEECRYRFGEN